MRFHVAGVVLVHSKTACRDQPSPHYPRTWHHAQKAHLTPHVKHRHCIPDTCAIQKPNGPIPRLAPVFSQETDIRRPTTRCSELPAAYGAFWIIEVRLLVRARNVLAETIDGV